MDLSHFKSSSTGKSKTVKSTSNPLKRSLLALKDWAYPQVTTLRQQRMSQYKDLSIFIGAALAVVVF
jgi:hypothetical protein